MVINNSHCVGHAQFKCTHSLFIRLVCINDTFYANWCDCSQAFGFGQVIKIKTQT